jgi:hypothetical protein
MTTSKIRSVPAEAWTKLARELAKTKPNQTVIKTQMKQVGLAYSPDPIDQMAQVLLALDGNSELRQEFSRKGSTK